MAPSGEFELIARLLAPLAAPGAWSLTDDAALLSVAADEELVVTKDLMVAGVHFAPLTDADLVARKLLRVNLSDLAAMGAAPVAYALGLALARPVSEPWLERFVAGLEADQRGFEVALIGGDTVSTPGPTVLSLTAFGRLPRGGALRRAGAQPGDRVLVSGTIGDAALGLRAQQGALPGLAEAARAGLRARLELPTPRLALGQRLRGLAHAAIDVSDGLIADLGHICAVSGVAARIEAGRVPLSDEARQALKADARLLETMLTGGDDYELLFCAPPDAGAALAALARALTLPLSDIGVIERGEGVRVRDLDGQPMSVARPGYSHM